MASAMPVAWTPFSKSKQDPKFRLWSIPETAKLLILSPKLTLPEEDSLSSPPVPPPQRLVADALSEVVPWKRKRFHHARCPRET